MVHFKCLYLDRRKEVGGRGVIFLESVLNRRSTFSEETSKKRQESRRRYRQTEKGERGIEIGRREKERERVEGHDLRTGVYHRWGIYYFGAVITTCPSLSSLFLANNELQPFRSRERRGECRGGRRPVAYPRPRVGVIANVITHVAQTSPCFTLSYVHADRGCGPRIIPLRFRG